MTQFYSGLLDFAGETLTVQRLALNGDTAALDATLTWNGAPWSFQSSAKALPNSPETFVFKARCRDLSRGTPGCTASTESTLRMHLKVDVAEVEVDGIWQESNAPDQYEVGGLLEAMSQQR